MFTEGLERKWDFKFCLSLFSFLRTNISYKKCIEHNNKIYD